jgi:hypothetical protein
MATANGNNLPILTEQLRLHSGSLLRFQTLTFYISGGKLPAADFVKRDI